MICSPQCLTHFRPYLTTVIVIFVLTLRSLYSDSAKVSPAGLHPSNGTLFFFFLVIFPLLFLKVIQRGDLISIGGWLYATSSPVSL